MSEAADHIQFKRVRPRIRVQTDKSSNEITSTIKERLKSGVCTCEGQVTRHFATIYPPSDHQHYWSPQLTITIEENEDETLVVP